MATKTQKLTAAKAAQFLSSKAKNAITTPCSVKLKIISNPVSYKDKVIFNLKGITQHGIATATELLNKGEFDAAANQGVSSSVFANSSMVEHIVKGNYVIAHFDYVKLKKDGVPTGEQALLVVDVTPSLIDRLEAPTSNPFASFLSSEDDSE
jgi:hypothetical protein